ncbi:nuclear transport factor 2 family protein [Sphingobacterium sp. UDSM-2020]|uniref:nuclear transport factor 2 family protein n=1 Tax=Sphingobacterium sp. UDSM-2020 TaxID=2795738 RepID=UPI0019369E05|nr:nuclear transport factor 2 family protein [Sphingobacterium sp. UDSM-2020]QQD12359.1 nuclear transport factor 2 family protein [Sphingobacterium sp. UDSM-2020]
MIEIVKRESVRKKDGPVVTMSHMDYHIICKVIDLIGQIGMDDEELSFLLGKANNYVFSYIANPNDKNKFKSDQVDLLPYLLNCYFSDLFPNNCPKGNIQLFHSQKINTDEEKGFSHIIYDSKGKGTRIIWTKKINQKGSFRKTNKDLLDLLIKWIDEGILDLPTPSINIWKKLISESQFEFSISDLEKCIKILSTKSILTKQTIDGIIYYWKSHPQTSIIVHYINAYNAFKAKSMAAYMAEDVVFENIHDGNTTMSLKGKDAFLEQAVSVLDLFENRKQTVTSILHRNNISEITIDYEAKLAKDLPNGMKKGQELRLKGRSIFGFSEDGKIMKLVDVSG